jgi:hypothetical protein
MGCNKCMKHWKADNFFKRLLSINDLYKRIFLLLNKHKKMIKMKMQIQPF